ncbi:MAG: Hcp family type VI secretion system effector [Gemmataceae bacterium]
MAQVDYFLDIDGIDGESKDDVHGDEIEVLSWSWGETNSGAGGFGSGAGTGKVAMQDFHFVMRFGKASPKLALACACGSPFKNAKLTCRKAGDKPMEYLTITFNDVLISSFQTGGSESGDVYPTDQISFNYTKIAMEFKVQKEDGSAGDAIKMGYDVKANKKA